MRLLVGGCLLCLGIWLGSNPAYAAPPSKITFNAHVRAILSNNCFYCHGPDEKHREANLRLDTREGATADLGGYAAIVPGKPAESVLLTRIAAHDPDELMPPPASKKPALSANEIEILRRWIEQGAEYEGHWAFLPLAKVAPPKTQTSAGILNPIDQFVVAKLEQANITPSSPADKATLYRRLSLDLTGLLPTPEEVAAFVNENDPQAYEKLVDRLLDSPHYGERWGRHWLDQARYADSNGYSIDSDRAMWPYRDWVIKALNDDMPFDQFTVEQLAGDLLPNATKLQRLASAFHRNTLINEEGGTDREQFRHEAVVDRVNTTGAVWLGLTLACAQCHTHKFDPIGHREYYQIFAFLNQTTDVNNKGATLSVVRGEVFGNPATITPTPPAIAPEELAKKQAQWEQDQLARAEATSPEVVKWAPLEYLEFDTKTGAGFKRLDDNSLLSDGRGAFNDGYRVRATTTLPKVAAIRLRVLTHESLPKQGPGRAGNGNFILTDFSVRQGDAELPITTAFADHEQPNYPVTGAIDDNSKSGWAINVGSGSHAKMNANHEAVFVLEKPWQNNEQPLEIQLAHDLNENYLIGRFALEGTESTPEKPQLTDAEVIAALRVERELRTAEQAKLIQTAFEQSNPEAAKARPKKETSPDVVEVMVMEEMATRRPTYIYQRGDFLRPDQNVGPLPPGVLQAVPPELKADDQLTRLDLAKWLIDPRNPLTPRVTVNRVWMRYFGRGLVETEEDFGTQGSPPSHPELLDWLASEFLRQGWSQKHLHRLIVNSATYRQSSQNRPELQDKDPRNLLLARQERVRVEAEIVRDAALSASGLLNRTIGGPSVRPPQPEGVYSFTQNAKRWQAENGPSRFRRAMYTQFYRSAPYPLFSTFDTPDFQTVCTRRSRSNTPLQALTVANDQAFVEFAQGLAARVLREVPTDDPQARLQRAFLLCLCREPNSTEAQVLTDYYQRQVQRNQSAEAAEVKALLSPELATNHATPAAVSAALVGVCRAILNTDAFITRE